MAEVTAPQAAEIIDISLMTIHRKVDDGTLNARQQGTKDRKFVYVNVDDLRQFAKTYGYHFDEKLAKEYAK